MPFRTVKPRRRDLLLCSAAVAGLFAAAPPAARAAGYIPGDLIISTSTFVPNTGEANTLTPGQQIVVDGTPLTTGAAATPVIAVASDANLGVFTNSKPDGNFGITAPLSISSVNPATGAIAQTTQLPVSQIVTSFPSKSEGTLQLSQGGQSITIAGYHVTTDAATPSPVGALDVSNASTTAFPDVGGAAGNSPRTDNRTVAQIAPSGSVATTDLTAYSGNNGRNSILYNGVYYTAGNANIGNTGVEILVPGTPVVGTASNSQQVGQFNITQVGYTADNVIKDNNFRGETIFNNTLYVSKGSGGNGIDTVYQVGATGALAGGANLAAGPATPITILPGFSTQLAKAGPDFTPFGLFFANATTLYVADEGTGDATDLALHAGLDKYTFNGTSWVFDYALQAGLTGTSQTYNAAGFTGTVFENGLRDITGIVNADGTVTIYGVTSTTDNVPNMDNGADPNEIVRITDNLAATILPSSEQFSVLEAPILGTVYRGAVLTVPEPGTLALLATGLVGFGLRRLRRQRAA